MSKSLIKQLARKGRQGFSIVEVLVVTVLVGVSLTAVASVLTVSTKNAAQVRFRAIATTRAQEAMEYFDRANVTTGWTSFTAPFAYPPPTGTLPTAATTYCLYQLPGPTQSIATITAGNCNAAQVIQENGGAFTRYAKIWKTPNPNPNRLYVHIIVSWQDGSRTASVSLQRVFTRQ